MKCGRPRWMLRQLFQVFFLSILSVLIAAAVLAYLLYFLPAFPPVSLISSSYQPQLYQQKGKSPLGKSAIIKSSASGSSLDSTFTNHFQDLQLVSLETAPIRHVSKRSLQEKKQDFGGGGGGGYWAAMFGLSSRRSEMEMEGQYRTQCSMFTCFDIHRCGGGGMDPSSNNGSLSIYVYPIYQWVVDGKLVQQSLSIEFYQFLESIKRSPYYVPDPNRACIFVPSIDLLNLNKLTVSSEDILAVLSSLEFWGQAGQNHVLLTMFPGNSPLLQLKTNAIIASSGLFVEHYRLGFHIPVISPSPLLFFNRSNNTSSGSNASNQHTIKNNDAAGVNSDVALGKRQPFPSKVKNSSWLAVAIIQGAFSFDDLLSSANHDNSILFLDYCHRHRRNDKGKKSKVDSQLYSLRCRKRNSYPVKGVGSSVGAFGSDDEAYQYPEILKQFDFCLVIRDLASPVLWEVMSAGCIPVIIADHQRLPFDEVIDWRMNSIQLYEHQIHQLSSILGSVSKSRRERLKAQVQFTFQTYFRDMKRISESLVLALKDRVFTHFRRSIQECNARKEGDESKILETSASYSVQSPLFNPVTAPKDAGFTAVILAYDRVASLFSVIQRVSQAPSLVKILIIWNNQLKEPPSLDSWPKVGVPVKIIKTTENKMSNRFFPYDEIETEAVFSLDDDIVMLTVDEMEFGFETWREFPDRLVGFPSRSHVWDNTTRRWKYESEWTSEISMVLTGAAFYHKYWHYAYTNELSRDIRDWVDAKMNCEDIAMNFLVSARTGKAPIKVTPRKKFKCPTCSNNEMLSADSGHMVERTDCINKFTQSMGFMPLIPTEFRADPVLFKVDGVPYRLKWYPDMGTM